VNDRQLLRIVGKNIQKARMQAGLTQECLAELSGVHWKTLSGVERGLFPVGLATFIRIAQHLNVSVDSLANGVEQPDPKRSNAIRKALARRRHPRNPTGK
jgi:transcriptional regulator with XRE-family HTH domain